MNDAVEAMANLMKEQRRRLEALNWMPMSAPVLRVPCSVERFPIHAVHPAQHPFRLIPHLHTHQIGAAGQHPQPTIEWKLHTPLQLTRVHTAAIQVITGLERKGIGPSPSRLLS